MSGFETQLFAVKIAEASSMGRAKWSLVHPLVFNSDIIGRRIVVPQGFTTDYASVPRVPLAYWLTGDTAHASAVIHDYLCREWYPACKISWRMAADVFRECMWHEGVPVWRRAIMHWAVMQADPAKKNSWSDES